MIYQYAVAKVKGVLYAYFLGITTITSCAQMALLEITHHKCCMLTYIRVWPDDTCCKCFPTPKPMSMSNSDSYISNMANNYRYSIFRVVAACTELVLRYIILFLWLKMFLSCTTVLSQTSQPAVMIHSISAEIWVIRLQKAEVHQWIYVPFDMKWHATHFTSVMWCIFK